MNFKGWLKQNVLLIALAVTMILGVGVGFLIREVDDDLTNDPRKVMYLNFPGELLVRMLKMIVVPVIVLRYFIFLTFYKHRLSTLLVVYN